VSNSHFPFYTTSDINKKQGKFENILKAIKDIAVFHSIYYLGVLTQLYKIPYILSIHTTYTYTCGFSEQNLPISSGKVCKGSQDELCHEQEKFKTIAAELEQTYAEMSGY
jgi:hypothetical protein